MRGHWRISVPLGDRAACDCQLLSNNLIQFCHRTSSFAFGSAPHTSISTLGDSGARARAAADCGSRGGGLPSHVLYSGRTPPLGSSS